MKTAAIFFAVLIPCVLSLGSVKIESITISPVVQRAPKLDLCPTCVAFAESSIDALLEIIVNIGVLDSCSSLCGALQNDLEAEICDFLCDYVGIDAFIEALDITDPDPIYYCQVLDLCPVVNGGAISASKAFAQPTSGPAGSTFNLIIQYTVSSPTGPGYNSILVLPPDGSQPIGDDVFNEGQATGNYQLGWQLPTTPSEQEPWNPGQYLVQLAICEGDCTTKHPYGGVYANVSTSFTITSSKF